MTTEGKTAGRMAYETTLPGSNKKVVVFKPFINEFNDAVKLAGLKSGESQAAMSMILAQELLRICLVSVNGKELSLSEKENLDNHFDIGEVLNLSEMMGQIAGIGQTVGKLTPKLMNR